MQIQEPKCSKRHCTWFSGAIKVSDNPVPVNVCRAFPNGIPDDIAYGGNKHSEVIEGQEGGFVFKKGKFEWED